MATKVLTEDGLEYYTIKVDAQLSKKVDKVSGKGLSTNDYDNTEKQKLANVVSKVNEITASGGEPNVIEIIKVNGSALATTDKTVNIDLSDYALKSDLASAVEWKGTVASVSALPTNAGKGDMYHVSEKSAEYVYDGSNWQEVGSIVDLSSYSTTSQMNTAISSAISSKADKSYVDTELGKKASTSILKAVATSGSYNDLTDKPIVDSALSSTSTNAIQNAVVTAQLELKMNKSDIVAITNAEIDAMFTS